jgi:hypothetical protein
MGQSSIIEGAEQWAASLTRLDVFHRNMHRTAPGAEAKALDDALRGIAPCHAPIDRS